MSEIIVKSVEVADIAIDQIACSSQATVRVQFAFTEQDTDVYSCRVEVQARFAQPVPDERYAVRSRNIALRKVNNYFGGKDPQTPNVFLN
jgi:hypothetical protein